MFVPGQCRTWTDLSPSCSWTSSTQDVTVLTRLRSAQSHGHEIIEREILCVRDGDNGCVDTNVPVTDPSEVI